MRRRQAPSPVSGFTLIELLTTMSIVAILLAVAVPNFLSFQRSSAVFSAASSFASALNMARAEAIKQGVSTYVRPLSGVDWSSGWQVYADVDRNTTYSTGDVLLLQQPALPRDVSVPASTTLVPAFLDGSVAYIRYDSTGIPRATPAGALALPNGVDFTAGSGSQATTRRVVLGVVGRARTCNPDPAKDPHCLVDDTN